MSAGLIPQPTPQQADLHARRQQLAGLRQTLADRELAAAELRALLAAFEGRYLRQVGILYADLDDLEARIAEREVALYQSDDARVRAAEARRQAEETRQAAFGAAATTPELDPPPTLKALFREIAKRIHPDFASDPADQQYRTLLMARANQAYTRGDTDALERLLDDFREASAPPDSEDPAAELTRLDRQMQHALRDIAALDSELESLPQTELAHLHRDAEAARRDGRDLLTELAVSIREKITAAQYRFDFLERQLYALGR